MEFYLSHVAIILKINEITEKKQWDLLVLWMLPWQPSNNLT